jgi:hypothetical protein
VRELPIAMVIRQRGLRTSQGLSYSLNEDHHVANAEREQLELVAQAYLKPRSLPSVLGSADDGRGCTAGTHEYAILVVAGYLIAWPVSWSAS